MRERHQYQKASQQLGIGNLVGLMLRLVVKANVDLHSPQLFGMWVVPAVMVRTYCSWPATATGLLSMRQSSECEHTCGGTRKAVNYTWPW